MLVGGFMQHRGAFHEVMVVALQCALCGQSHVLDPRHDALKPGLVRRGSLIAP